MKVLTAALGLLLAKSTSTTLCRAWSGDKRCATFDKVFVGANFGEGDCEGEGTGEVRGRPRTTARHGTVS